MPIRSLPSRRIRRARPHSSHVPCPCPTPLPAAPQAARPGLFSAPRQDLLASLVVFLIAIPLSLGIALASGAPIMAGLIAGIVGGMVTGLVAGAPLQVTGPAAGLTAIVFGWSSNSATGGWSRPLSCLAALIQMALGASRIARLCLAVSPAVVHGMLAGIGITIALAQLHIVLGGAPESQALENLLALPAQLMDLHAPAAFLGLATIALLLAWQWVPRPLSAVPASLVAVMTATAASVLLGLDVERINLQGGFAQRPAVRGLAGRRTLDRGARRAASPSRRWPASSRCSARWRPTSCTRARAPTSIANWSGRASPTPCPGCSGGLPVTGVIVRSSANIQAGARTQLSAILHSVWILLFVLFLGSGIEMIPLCVLAGLLVHVGIRLVDAHHIRQLVTFGEALVYFVDRDRRHRPRAAAGHRHRPRARARPAAAAAVADQRAGRGRRRQVPRPHRRVDDLRRHPEADVGARAAFPQARTSTST